MAGNVLVIVLALVFCSRVALAVWVRVKAKRMFDIEDCESCRSTWREVATVLCCYSCALCQLKSTMDLIEAKDIPRVLHANNEHV